MRSWPRRRRKAATASARFLLLLQHQAGYTAEMPPLSCRQRRRMVHSRGGDQRVGVGDEVAGLAKLPAGACEHLHGAATQRQDGHRSQEPPESLHRGRRVERVVVALIDFTIGNDADMRGA